ncbi:MAG: lactate 2-monooxygenase [Microscillaceae bacterium]|jgi:isopentenyl diphosphate isomerase/L-lactate dehydrogenase-like FMN-dependent dehydrogenase|nr:lactate 2-monooxygenase [Microscillaceae bacterium]
MENNIQTPFVGVQRQMQIYMQGLQNIRPQLPVAFEDLEAKARQEMKPQAFGYIAGGAGGGSTMQNNQDAFKKWQILPRMLRNVSTATSKIELLGHQIAAPIVLAPIGVLSIAHPEAEIAVAKAARAMNIPFTLSTVSAKPLEAVAQASGDAPRFFQLYWGRNPEFMKSLISRAEASGYSAIMVTLDTRMLAWRELDIQNAYLPFFFGEGLANYFSDPVFRATLSEMPEKNPLPAIMQFGQIFTNPELTWDDFKVLREHTKLPIILKGILHPDDARMAMDYGADGVVVSNHGGRQVDGSVGALDMLPKVVEAIGDRGTVLFDSGIRRGSDVFKAIALGAKAVLLGRSYAYGLALNGEEGVKEVTMNLIADADLTLGLSGCTHWSEVGMEHLIKA